MAGFDIRGAIPATLPEIYGDDLKDVWDPDAVIANLVVAPMLQEQTPGVPAQLTYDNVPATPDEVLALIQRGLQPQIAPDVEKALHELYSKALCDYTYSPKTLSKEVYVNQAAAEANLKAPTPLIVYQTSDILQSAKRLLAGKPLAKESFFASIGYMFHPEALGFWVLNQQSWLDFQDFCAIETVKHQADLTPDAQTAIRQIPSLKLNEPTLGILLRAAGQEDAGNQPGTFARFIVACAMEFSSQNPDRMGPMPFALDEFACPHALVFANVDAHAHSLAADVRSAWDDVKQATANKPRLLSQSQIQNLTSVPSALKKAKKKAQSQAQGLANGQGNGQGQGEDMRRMEARFSRAQPKATKLLERAKKLLLKMGAVNKSSNSWKEEHRTYMRPSRRDPMSPYLKGKSSITRYKPDIHIYLDTSGSICERHYQAGMMAAIKLASALDVDLYFNSFSHVLSTCVKLPTKQKTVKQIYNVFARVQKVGGGTDYEQIWDYINASPKRRKELSIILTDFEWMPPNHHFTHPQNLYYFPVAADSQGDWDRMVADAKEFCQAMQGQAPNIRAHLLF